MPSRRTKPMNPLNLVAGVIHLPDSWSEREGLSSLAPGGRKNEIPWERGGNSLRPFGSQCTEHSDFAPELTKIPK